MPDAGSRRQGRQGRQGVTLARALSKLGHCSRNEARRLVQAGQVRVNGDTPLDPDVWVELGRDRIEVEGESVRPEVPIYLMLNKPRGLVTTAVDEGGRGTVFDCFADAHLPHLGAVGRLDRASEGLLLFTNDTRWAARILDPASHVAKSYHVQIDQVAGPELLRRLSEGVITDQGERLNAREARLLRAGSRNSWLEVVLDEGKNRQIRRLLGALGAQVLRLVRVAVGPVQLGELAKGDFRALTPEEVRALTGKPGPAPNSDRSGRGLTGAGSPRSPELCPPPSRPPRRRFPGHGSS